MPVGIFPGHYSLSDCRKNPDDLFVFGDNMVRRGTGGQAAIRSAPNAIGLATKHTPSTNSAAYFSNADIDLFREEVRRIHAIISPALKSGKKIWFPAGGLGSGLSRMPDKAPDLYQGLCKYLGMIFRQEHDSRLISIAVPEHASSAALSELVRQESVDGGIVELVHSIKNAVPETCIAGARISYCPAFSKFGKPSFDWSMKALLGEMNARRDQYGIKTKFLLAKDPDIAAKLEKSFLKSGHVQVSLPGSFDISSRDPRPDL